MLRNIPLVQDITIIKGIGAGGYGRVFLAESPSLGQVVVKTLHLLLEAEYFELDEEGILQEEDQFYKEMQAMIKFSHPNIIKLHGVWFSNDTRRIPYIVSEMGEYCFGKFLFSQKIEKAQAIKFAHQIASGIKYVHENSIAHRDIKPDNIVLVKEGSEYVAKLIDFGDCKLFSNAVLKTVVGTSAYQDPRVLMGIYDESVDIFSFGCVLIQMVLGYESLCTWRFSKDTQPIENEKLSVTLANKLGEELAALVTSCISVENRINASALVEKLASFMKGDLEPLRVEVDENSLIAQNNMALQYFYGDGVEVDQKKAVELWTLAANKGYLDSQFLLADCYFRAEGVEEDFEKAVIWWTMAANQGHPGSQSNLGNCYAAGVGVEVNPEKAVEWWTLAANQGVAEAQFNLADCYANGEGVEVNLEKAVELWTLAANQGDPDAQYCLGECYYNGDGVEKDRKKAVELWTKSAKQDFADAQYRLGRCYRNGKGVKADTKRAREWFTLAANQGHKRAKKTLKRSTRRQ